MQKLASVEEQNSRKKGRDEEAITPPQVEQSPVENLAAQAEKTAPTPENAKGMVKDASSAAQAESLATQGQIAETSTAIEQLASAGKVSPESAAEAVAAETQLAKQEEQMSAELAGAFDFLDDAIDSVSAKSPPTPKTKRAETVKTKPTAERMVTRPGKYGEEKFPQHMEPLMQAIDDVMDEDKMTKFQQEELKKSAEITFNRKQEEINRKFKQVEDVWNWRKTINDATPDQATLEANITKGFEQMAAEEKAKQAELAAENDRLSKEVLGDVDIKKFVDELPQPSKITSPATTILEEHSAEEQTAKEGQEEIKKALESKVGKEYLLELVVQYNKKFGPGKGELFVRDLQLNRNEISKRRIQLDEIYKQLLKPESLIDRVTKKKEKILAREAEIENEIVNFQNEIARQIREVKKSLGIEETPVSAPTAETQPQVQIKEAPPEQQPEAATESPKESLPVAISSSPEATAPIKKEAPKKVDGQAEKNFQSMEKVADAMSDIEIANIINNFEGKNKATADALLDYGLEPRDVFKTFLMARNTGEEFYDYVKTRAPEVFTIKEKGVSEKESFEELFADGSGYEDDRGDEQTPRKKHTLGNVDKLNIGGTYLSGIRHVSRDRLAESFGGTAKKSELSAKPKRTKDRLMGTEIYEEDEEDPFEGLGDESYIEMPKSTKPTKKAEQAPDALDELNAEAEPEDRNKASAPTATREAVPTAQAAVEQSKTPEVLTEVARKKQIMEMYKNESKSAHTEEDKKLAWLRVYKELKKGNNSKDTMIVKQTDDLRKEWASKDGKNWPELLDGDDYKFQDQHDLQTGQALLTIIESMDKDNVIPIKQRGAGKTASQQTKKAAA